MGWDGIYTRDSNREVFERDFIHRQWHYATKCLGYSFVGTTCYSVFEQTRDGVTDRFAMVTLFKRDKTMVYYKNMTEADGPNLCAIPAKLFKLLEGFPPVGEYAIGWRKRAQEALNSPKAPSIEAGKLYRVRYYGEDIQTVIMLDFKRHRVKIVGGRHDGRITVLRGLKKEYLIPA